VGLLERLGLRDDTIIFYSQKWREALDAGARLLSVGKTA
jgi:hypothetical protein